MTARANPYVGLGPFGEDDHEWFFGREREITLITANLKASRLTLLYGASGVGKSSVLLAGVLPHLHALVAGNRAMALAAEQRGAIALDERPPLAVALVRDWRDAPLESVVRTVHAAVTEASGRTDLPPFDPNEPLATHLDALSGHVRTLLVILDQFEEYFMYHPDEDGPGTLAGELPGVVNDIELRVNFVVGLREDALSQLDRFKGRIPDLFGNYLRLDYLDREAGREAIVAPARHFNETVRSGAAPVEIEPALVEDVLDEIRAGRLTLTDSQEPAAADAGAAPETGERIETPYLQLVMEELWRAGTAAGGGALTRETLAGLGGASAIVSNHLVAAMSQLSPSDQGVAADVFGFLVTPSRTKISQSAADLGYWAKRPEEDVRRVLDTLARSERRILREEDGRYELYHDVLAEAVYDWSTRVRQQRALVEAQRERRRRWLKRAGLVLAGIVLVAAAVAAALTLRDEGGETPAQRANRIADHAEQQLAVDPERSALLALTALASARTPRAENAAGAALSALRVRASYLNAKPRPCVLDGCDLAAKGRTAGAVTLAARSAPNGQSESGLLLEPGEDQKTAVAPDGRTIAVVRGGRVRLWHPQDGGAPGTLDPGKWVRRVAFIGDGRRLLLLTDGGALLADATGQAAPKTLAPNATFAAASADGRYVATTAGRKGVTVHPTDGGPPKTLRLGGPVASLAFDPATSRTLLVATQDGVSLVDRRTGKKHALEISAVGVPAAVAARRGPAAATAVPVSETGLNARFSPDGRLVVVSSSFEPVRVWDARTRAVKFRAPAQFSGLAIADIDPKGRRLLTVDRNLASVWSLSSGRLLDVLGGHAAPILDAAFSDNGSRIVTGAADGQTIVWDTASGNALTTLQAVGRTFDKVAITHVEFGPGGRLVVTGGADGSTRVWAATAGAPLAGSAVGPAEYAFDEDTGEAIVVPEIQGPVRYWDGHRGGRPLRTTKLPARTGDVELSSDGGTLAYAVGGRKRGKLAVGPVGGGPFETQPNQSPTGIEISGDGESILYVLGPPRVYRPAERRLLHIGGSRLNNVETGTLSRDGSHVVLGTFDNRVLLVDMSNPARTVALRDPALRGAADAQFSPDGSRLITIGGPAALVWDTSTARVVKRMRSYVGTVTSAAYSPDGTRIATGGDDRTIVIRDANDYKRLETLTTATAPERLVFSPDRQRILMVPQDFTPAVLYTCRTCQPPDTVTRDARAQVTRALTPAEIKNFVDEDS